MAYRRQRVRRNRGRKARRNARGSWNQVRQDLGVQRSIVNIFRTIDLPRVVDADPANPNQWPKTDQAGYAVRPLWDLWHDARFETFKQCFDECRIKRVKITINQKYTANLQDPRVPAEGVSITAEDFAIQTFSAWDRNSLYTSSAPINRDAIGVQGESMPNPVDYVSSLQGVKQVVSSRYYNPPLVAMMTASGPQEMNWLNSTFAPSAAGTPNQGMFFNPCLYVVNLLAENYDLTSLIVHEEIELECRGSRFGKNV